MDMKSFYPALIAPLFILSRMDLQPLHAQAPIVVPPPSYARNRSVETTLAVEFRPCDSKASQLLKMRLTTMVQDITSQGEILLRHSVQSQGVSGSTYSLQLDKRGTPLSVKVASGEPDGQGINLLIFAMRQLLRPTHAVRLGSRWTTRMQNPLNSQSHIRVITKFMGSKMVQGRLMYEFQQTAKNVVGDGQTRFADHVTFLQDAKTGEVVSRSHRIDATLGGASGNLFVVRETGGASPQF